MKTSVSRKNVSASARRVSLLLIGALSISSATVWAATVPYTHALISAYNPDESPLLEDQHSAPASASSSNYSKSGVWGNASGSASADLATGQLKVKAAANPNDNIAPYMQSNAWFGDGFRASTPSGPFQWNANATSRFTLDLTGSIVQTSSSLQNLGVGGFVLLSIYQKDTLDTDGKLVGGANNIQYFLYLLGNPDQHLSYTDPQGNNQPLVPTASYTDLSSNIHISQDFQPNGDFDWAILLGASGQVTGPNFYNMDFSHTLSINYGSPAGTTTTSTSTLFNSFSPTPEPGTLSLVCVGVSLMMRRRRKI